MANIHNKYICTQHQKTKIYTNSNRSEVRNRQQSVTVGDFNTPLSTMDRSFRQKIIKEVLDLTCTLDHMNLKDRHRTFHPTATDYTFISSTRGTFSRANHVRKQVLRNLWRVKHTKYLFWPKYFNTRNNDRRSIEEFTYMWKLYNS